ncbi:conserved unknown protein [Ectocarpus siliculosus]|uniref:JmjC domain-containing protein n=1 Tax=Ectocarpus siliculosus TaxID=2880 RepID=D7FK99_ECTSI|nr:conserved unknown protein [Ectocarpus siliculosus]|eukprot:CBJ29304.1 conserved unknown protein [Ectocarpus siliculosus]
MATTLQHCEVPFKVVGYPEAEAASKKWTDEYLLDRMQRCPRCNVMKSVSNRFMFWHKKGGKHDGSWEPPTQPQYMPFEKWLNWTQEAETNRIGPEDVHYYLTVGVKPSMKTPPDTGDFVADDLPFFSTSTNNFFIPDVSHQKGIQCRFGARGIIAESHFDHGKNFVFMLRGRKRYLMNPPRACPSLGIITERAHPSFRHSDIDWSDESDWPEGFADAPALETVLEAGELLYIPSFWYHYIVSEGFNVQCNARSGLSLRKQWVDETESCMGRELNPDKMVDLLRRSKNKGGGGMEGMAARLGRGGRGKEQGHRERAEKRGQRPHHP